MTSDNKDEKKKTVLIVDDEEDIRDYLTMAIESQFDAKVELADSGNAAIDFLKQGKDCDLIISDYNMINGNGGALYLHWLETDMDAPFVLSSTESPDDHDEFKVNKLAAHLMKPYTMEQLGEVIKTVMPSEEEVKKDYCRVRTMTLLKLGKLTADVFIKMSSSKFVKVMKKDDDFTQDDYQKFQKKKLDELYIASSDFERFLFDYQKEVLSAAMAKEALTSGKAFEVGTETLGVLHEASAGLGWTPEVQQLAKENIEMALSAISKNPTLSEMLEKLTTDPKSYLASHSMLLSYIAVGIARGMGWTSNVTHFKLALAAMLHDLTLDDRALEQVHRFDQMAREVEYQDMPEIVEYKKHPEEATTILDHWRDVPSADVSQAILEHHESPDGKGFPKGLGAQQISPLAAVLIVAEDLVNFRFQHGHKADYGHFVQSRQTIYAKGEFKNVMASLESGLLNKKAA